MLRKISDDELIAEAKNFRESARFKNFMRDISPLLSEVSPENVVRER